MRSLLVILLTLLLAASSISQVNFTDSDLPIVIINTVGGVPIPDEPRVLAQMEIKYNGPGVRNYMTDPHLPGNYLGRIEIEIRGSTSQQYPKKGYGFETKDDFGIENNVNLLGMPSEHDWILYGPYPDKTCIRNDLTFQLARNMGHYASDTRFCELVLNGDYRGLYVLMERIKRDVDRVNINDVTEQVIGNDTLTGGYIMKVDKLTGEVGYSWASPYNSEVLFQFHDPEYEELGSAQVNYMKNHIQEFEDALAAPTFADPSVGWPAYIDQTSFHDFFILQELGRTVDGYRSSSFFYKEQNNGNWNSPIVAGPMWDFNLSYGNADYCDANLTTGWQYEFDLICNFTSSIPFWWGRLLQDPNYANGLRCRWEELRQGPLHTDSIHYFIDSVANYIEEARIRNFQRWPIIGVYVNWNGYVGQTYEDDLNYFKSYIEQRALWLDNNIPGTCSLAIPESEKEIALHTVWPNPASDEINIGYTLTTEGEVNIQIIDPSGRIVLSTQIAENLSSMPIVTIGVGSLQKGSYMYRVIQNGSPLYTGKFIKQ